ncbi:MAG: OmpA family protein, partial [Comamonas sp.]|nr:OmpA family protein [Candidatus Comamonas equi]
MWLRKIASVTHASDYCMTVVGHTSRTGSEAVNERLSQARARTVRDMLVA